MDIKNLLSLSVQQGASDLHLSSGLPPLLRIDGELVRLEYPSIIAADLHTKLNAIMNEIQQKEYADYLEIDFSVSISEVARFRVNAFHQTYGPAAVFRTISHTIPDLESLALPAIFKQITEFRQGLVLVTGPTGSGKSTTLAAMINYLNTFKSQHIITIEDPIEFLHTSKKCLINQREVKRDTHSFNAALRSALREDPNVILVGEMRDLETIRLALTAAETGQLVLATLHTSSAAKTINRIVDVFPAEEKSIVRAQLSESLQAVICQSLIKRKIGGRVAALEIMLGTPAIRNLIRENKIAQVYTAIQTGSNVGMHTLDQYLQELIKKGVIEREICA